MNQKRVDMNSSLDTEISYIGGQHPFGEDDSVHFFRRKSTRVVAAPSLINVPLQDLASLLGLNDEIWLTCPKAHYDDIINRFAEFFDVRPIDIRKRVLLLDDLSNPFDDMDMLRSLLEPGYLPSDIESQIDMCATGILCQTQESENLAKEWDDSLLDMFPIAVPFFQMRSRWMPIAYRTRYLTKVLQDLNAMYVSLDDYEVKIHDYLYYFGKRDSQTIRDGIKNGSFLPSVDHRPFILKILIQAMRQIENKDGWDTKDAKHLVKKDNNRLVLSEIIESIADRLYAPPFYISQTELSDWVNSELVKLIKSVIGSPGLSAALGVAGNIPLPIPVPNPVSLYTAFNDYISKKRLNSEFGWILYLVNIAEASPYFTQSPIAPIPNIQTIRLKDDIIFSVAGTWVLNKNGPTLHRSSCRHLQNVKKYDIRLFLDSLGNWPNVDAYKCKSCLS